MKGLQRFTRSIRDSLHGTIHLSDEEVDIIDHPLFQRLHSIKQNGPLYLVFPSATHKRFEHSLGVLSVTDSAFKSLVRNSYVAKSKSNDAVADIGDAAEGEAIAFHQLEDKKLRSLHRAVRIAGLLHDIGHGPLSHSFEGFAPSGHRVVEFIEDELGKYSDIGSAIRENITDGSGDLSKSADHEHLSCLLSAYLYDNLEKEYNGEVIKGEDIPRFVASSILGNEEIVGDYPELRKFTPLMKDLIASAPADADRMDYLERDSRSAGVTYGLYDRERVLKSFLPHVEENTENEESKRYSLGIKESGLRAIENFMQARYELYVQVYFHKTNRGAQLMLEEISSKAEKDKRSLLDIGRYDSIPDLYKSLSDGRFLRILEGSDEEYDIERYSKSSDIKELARRINSRDIWRRVYEGGTEVTTSVVEKMADNKRSVTGDEVFGEPAKNLAEGAKLLTRQQQDVYRSAKAEAWTRRSSIIEAIKENTEEIHRVYYTGYDDQQFRDLQSRAREFARQEENETGQ